MPEQVYEPQVMSHSVVLKGVRPKEAFDAAKKTGLLPYVLTFRRGHHRGPLCEDGVARSRGRGGSGGAREIGDACWDLFFF